MLTCKSALDKNKIPVMSVYNGFKYPDIPEQMCIRDRHYTTQAFYSGKDFPQCISMTTGRKISWIQNYSKVIHSITFIPYIYKYILL